MRRGSLTALYLRGDKGTWVRRGTVWVDPYPPYGPTTRTVRKLVTVSSWYLPGVQGGFPPWLNSRTACYCTVRVPYGISTPPVPHCRAISQGGRDRAGAAEAGEHEQPGGTRTAHSAGACSRVLTKFPSASFTREFYKMGIPETLKRPGPLVREGTLWDEARGRVVGFDLHTCPVPHLAYSSTLLHRTPRMPRRSEQCPEFPIDSVRH